MKRIIMLALALLVVALTACGNPTPTPTLTPLPPTAVPPAIATATKPAPTATAVPPTGVPPSATAVPPTATVVPPTATVVPPTATKPAPTATAVPPTAIPATAVPAGLYVSTLRIQPDRPAFNQDVTFAPTFINTATGDQNIKWTVYIFRADQANVSANETTAQLTAFPVGAKEFASLGSFRYGPTGRVCEYFFARVGYFDSENKIKYFTTPDGKTYEKGFQVCDLAVIPTLAPAPAAPPTAVPTPKPGLFVTDLRIQPVPQRGADLTFFPTFVNTSGGQMSFTWRVFVYKADNANTSYSETTWQLTNFNTAPGEVLSLGKWTLPLGGDCENYFARVGWQDANNQNQFFMKPDGTIFTKSFNVCPP